MAFGLAREGYNVSTATSGADAILRGSVSRPSVLITDWMLCDHVDGLEVADALRIVSPTLPTILMTGFSSTDVRANARRAEIFQFVEKPFRLEDIRTAVSNAAETTISRKARLRIGFLQVDSNGRVMFSNRVAQELLSGQAQPLQGKSFDDFFAEGDESEIDDSMEHWVELRLRDMPLRYLSVRGRKVDADGGRIFVLLDQLHEPYRDSMVVRRLIGLPDAGRTNLGLSGHLLVVDDHERVRRVIGEIFKDFRCVCHTADSADEALKLFHNDEEIRYVFIDCEMSSTNTQEILNHMRSIRPNVHIVGTSEEASHEEVLDAGADSYLRKPWHEEEFLDVLNNLRNCA